MLCCSDLIKKYYKGILQNLQENDIGDLSAINYTAACFGHFHICDYLSENYGVSQTTCHQDNTGNITLKLGSTVHYLAYYGEDERLAIILESNKDVVELSCSVGYPIHDAIRGGHRSTVDLLCQYDDNALSRTSTNGHYNCVSAAA